MTSAVTEGLLTAEQVAGRLGVKTATVWQWRWRGEGPKARYKIGGRLWYHPIDVDDWIDQQREGAR
jgi:predicted DNA-binding transcriptional regulator AlpA